MQCRDLFAMEPVGKGLQLKSGLPSHSLWCFARTRSSPNKFPELFTSLSQFLTTLLDCAHVTARKPKGSSTPRAAWSCRHSLGLVFRGVGGSGGSRHGKASTKLPLVGIIKNCFSRPRSFSSTLNLEHFHLQPDALRPSSTLQDKQCYIFWMRSQIHCYLCMLLTSCTDTAVLRDSCALTGDYTARRSPWQELTWKPPRT